MTNLRIAVVGAGPAGLYATEHLLERAGPGISVDILERLVTPGGLVRFGVAPDHPEKKLIQRRFDVVLRDPRVRFIGNIEVGSDVSNAQLEACYNAVIYAVGGTGDVRMGVAGENLRGCIAAREFVAFYNGHPDAQDLQLDLSGARAVIVGNGNVALDVARILVTPVDELAKTDISDKALALLKTSTLSEVVILGRRGPLEAAYNNPELEELAHLPGVDVEIAPDSLVVSSTSDHWETRRKAQTLARLARRPWESGRKHIVFRFLSSPVEVMGDQVVRGLRCERNMLERDPHGIFRVRPTGRLFEIETGVIFRAVGYCGRPITGLPFDEASGTVPNIRGRIVGTNGLPLGNLYVTGWIKRGCHGIIGTNRLCAKETVEALFEDFSSRSLDRRATTLGSTGSFLNNDACQPTSFAGWRRIDRYERDAGRRAHRPRIKLTDHAELLGRALDDGRP
jgi:ferredoxin--NADP+ reductase